MFKSVVLATCELLLKNSRADKSGFMSNFALMHIACRRTVHPLVQFKWCARAHMVVNIITSCVFVRTNINAANDRYSSDIILSTRFCILRGRCRDFTTDLLVDLCMCTASASVEGCVVWCVGWFSVRFLWSTGEHGLSAVLGVHSFLYELS